MSRGDGERVGVVVVAHSNLAEGLVQTARSVLGTFSAAAVSVAPEESMDRIRKRIRKAIKQVDRGAGVVILTDLVGGTATNLSLEVSRGTRAQVLAGVNLPILIKLSTLRVGDPKALVRALRRYGQRQIIEASPLVEERVKTVSRGRR